MVIEVGTKVVVETPRRAMDGRITGVNGNMVSVLLNGQQVETDLFMEEVSVRVV